ncbi:hypothetical protein BASA81_007371 [Batrachochytrium salamandrivorans]|nr:hypothetical protein BASA81_007371 [Batrachochytrium salamandrivorans]
MGGSKSKPASGKGKSFTQAEAISKKLEQTNLKDWVADQKRIKLLLLGAGESGKSTIFKQMKLIYNKKNAFPESQRQAMAHSVHAFILSNARVLVNAAFTLKEDLDDPSLISQINDAGFGQDRLSLVEGDVLLELWEDAGAQRIWKRRNELQIQDSLAYFIGELNRVCQVGYLPSVEDVIRIRTRTTGIVEEELEIDNVPFLITDVGGQRNERKKWIFAFDDVHAIVFVAAINEYNSKLFEDKQVNRLDEALQLFSDTCHLPAFATTPVILFLNKTDLLRDALKRFPVSQSGYLGPHSVEGESSHEFELVYQAATNFFLQQFLKGTNPKQQVFHHFTNATDTTNVSTVFNACKDILLKEQLQYSGFGDVS